MREKKIELLAPAGDMERLEMAVAYGADAVYLAGTTFGMRSFAGNFTPEELKRAVALCHKKGVRVHVTCNTMPRNDEVARLPEWLTYLDQVGVDAVILADVGVMALAGKYAPHVQRHISTQASIVNYETARAWHDLGADRVILARELSLDEIREIRAKTPPELELEAFAHGASQSVQNQRVHGVPQTVHLLLGIGPLGHAHGHTHHILGLALGGGGLALHAGLLQLVADGIAVVQILAALVVG